MKLARLGLAFYRSIGEEPAIIDLRKRVTVVIGANNSGKSNVLSALQLLKEQRGVLSRISPTDRHLRDDRNNPRVVVDFEVQPGDGFPSTTGGELIRFVREFSGAEPRWIDTPFSSMKFSDFNRYYHRQLGRQFGAVPKPKDLVVAHGEVAQYLYGPLLASIPELVFIPQHRQITAASEYVIHGAGIVDLLASWQHPDIGADQDSKNFMKVQELLRSLLHLPSVELEVPHDKSTIIVRRDGLRLPLQSYGTGIHQLIVLAVAVLSYRGALICIEEPEVNLHPTLQRELLRFLIGETDNRYVISTHSQALIEPQALVDVLHVSLRGQVTVPRLVQAPQDSLSILRDLGVRASDLLQANSVIWVEGPSDRIYLNRWLALVAPDLVEGVHYSVMFYGGRLLSHLSMDRDVAAVAHDLVRLMRINQYSAIVIDSDRRQLRGRLNPTKTRIQEEATASGIYCWITDGREIENYLAPEAVAAAYSELTEVDSLKVTLGLHDSLEDRLKEALGKQWRPKYSYDQAKPQRAREIARKLADGHLDPKLRRHLKALVQIIRSASELYHEDH